MARALIGDRAILKTSCSTVENTVEAIKFGLRQ